MDSVIGILKELQDYYDKQLTPAQAKVYIRNLDDIEITMLRQGADYLIQQGAPFMPKVAELRKAAKHFSPLPQEPSPLYMSWKAMQVFNDVLAGRLPDSALDDYEQYFPKVEEEVEDAPSS